MCNDLLKVYREVNEIFDSYFDGKHNKEVLALLNNNIFKFVALPVLPYNKLIATPLFVINTVHIIAFLISIKKILFLIHLSLNRPPNKDHPVYK